MNKLVGIIATICIALAVIVLNSLPVYAAGEQSCKNNYHDTNSMEYIACLEGYQHGDNQHPICTAEFSTPRTQNGVTLQPAQLQAACQAGYQMFVNESNACGNNASCKENLRPSGAWQPENVGTDTDPQQPGPIPKSADINKLHGDGPDLDHAECGIEGFFGTLVCEASKTASRIADASFNMLTIFLKTPQILTTTEDGQPSPIYNAWLQLRNIANFAFVFAFLVVIYSQLTNVGISNYNIKRILPRLIISALLINLSFYVCAIIVDLSNVLGATLTNTLGALVPPTPKTGGPGGWETIVGSTLLITSAAAVATAAVLFLNLSIIIPVLASVVITLVITLLLLLARQALIVIFIIISPLAMAAIILPGTMQWFDRWRKLFIPIVMLYPTIALIYGGCQIAGQVIETVSAGNNHILLTIFSLGIQVIPLMLTPTLMKLGGGVMSRYAGIAQGSTPVGKFKNKADEYAKYRGSLRTSKVLNRDGSSEGSRRYVQKTRDNMTKRGITRDNRRKILDDAHKGTLEDFAIDSVEDGSVGLLQKAKAGITGGEALTRGEQYQQQLAQSKNKELMSRAKAHTIHERVKAHAKKVNAQKLAIERQGISGDNLTEMATQGTLAGQQVSAVQREAAILRIGQMGDVMGIVSLIKMSNELSVEQRQTLVSSMQSKGAIAKAPFLANATAIDNILKGAVTADNFSHSVVAPSLAQDDYSPESLTTLDGNGAKAILDAVANPPTAEDANNGENFDDTKATIVGLDHEKIADLNKAAYDALAENRTNAAITGARAEINQLANAHVASMHEEATVQNKLYDMEQDAKDKARGNYTSAIHEEAIKQNEKRNLEIAHEEALVQNRLFDMNNRGGDDEPK